MGKSVVVLCHGLDPEQADRVILLLAAMGIEASATGRGDRDVCVTVTPEDIDAARRLLREEFPYGPARNDSAATERPVLGADAEIEPPASWFGRGTVAVLLLIGLCTSVFILAQTGPDAGTRRRLIELGAITWSRLERGEYWRLVAAIFVHFDIAHLLTNMGAMLLLAPPLAHILGPKRFLVVFLLAGVSGNLLSHELAPAVGLKAGASGALAGVLGALGGQALRPGAPRRIRSWQVLGALAAFYGLVVGFGPGRDNVAHLGGFVSGIVLGRMLAPLPGQSTMLGSVSSPRAGRSL